MEKTQQGVFAKKTVPHPQYNRKTLMNDIAVVQLQLPIKFNEFAQPACLPAPSEELAHNTMATVSGWGFTQEEADGVSNVLNQVGVPVINNTACNSAYYREGIRIRIDRNAMLCAGYDQGGMDACQGDSGGPFVVRNADGNNVLHGVVSFGIGCARAGLPGVYAKVSNYIPWINQQVEALSSLAG